MDKLSVFLRANGFNFATSVPGFGATGAFDDFRQGFEKDLPYSFHEEVAYCLAHSYAMNKGRSAVFIKTHGLFKAANAVIDSVTTGNSHAFLVFIFEDQDGSHSDNIIYNSKKLAQSFSPLFYDLTNDYDSASILKKAINDSEQKQLPVILWLHSDQALTCSLMSSLSHATPMLELQTVLAPPLSFWHNENLILRINGHKTKPFLKDNSFEEKQKPHVKEQLLRYEPFFLAMSKIDGVKIIVDAGISSILALHHKKLVHFCTYMGASVPLGIGQKIAFPKSRVIATSGDFSFISAAYLGLIEAKNRQVDLDVVILDNAKAGATGGQPINQKTAETVYQSLHAFGQVYNFNGLDSLNNFTQIINTPAQKLRFFIIQDL